MNELRAFIAIEIPDVIKTAIARQTAILQVACGGAVRWVTPANMHLTLKFLGGISPTKVEPLSQMLQNICQKQSPFEISVSGAGTFPYLQRPRVLWVGLNSPPDLERLQRRIETVAMQLGFKREERLFSAHLTIGRVRQQITVPELDRLQKALTQPLVGEMGKFSPSAVILFKSELRPAGALYTMLFNAPLGG